MNVFDQQAVRILSETWRCEDRTRVDNNLLLRRNKKKPCIRWERKTTPFRFSASVVSDYEYPATSDGQLFLQVTTKELGELSVAIKLSF